MGVTGAMLPWRWRMTRCTPSRATAVRRCSAAFTPAFDLPKCWQRLSELVALLATLTVSGSSQSIGKRHVPSWSQQGILATKAIEFAVTEKPGVYNDPGLPCVVQTPFSRWPGVRQTPTLWPLAARTMLHSCGGCAQLWGRGRELTHFGGCQLRSN